MINKIKKFISEKDLCKKDDKLLLAISGGADSVCLFFVLRQLGYYFELAHCNFKLRNNESDEDESFVKLLAKKYGIKIHVKHFETQRYSIKNKVSIQMAARDLRYNWFNKLLVDNKLNYVLTAHNKDDSIETFFINLIRGSGIKGLSGIKAKNNLIIRPLLNISRDEIECYLKNRKQIFRNDSSNNDIKYLRNKIRLSLIPLLKEINPNINNIIEEEMLILDGVNQIFENQVESTKNKILKQSNGRYEIKITELLMLDNIEIYLFEILSRFNFKEVKQIVRAINSQSGKKFISLTHQLIIDRDFIFISKLEQKNTIIKIYENDRSISDPLRLFCDVSEDSQIINNNNLAKLDFYKLSFPLILRKWTDGDRFKPLGMQNFKKLSDFFIDEKYSILDKQNQWILCSGDDIVWVVGKRIDDRYKIETNTKKVYIAKLLN